MEKTSNPSMKSSKVTERIYTKAFELLEKHQEGLHWSELLSKIKVSDPSFHPKTVNGCVWKLIEKFPDKIYKPSKGVFRLLKYKSNNTPTTVVEQYIESQPEATRKALKELRACILEAVPDAEELLNYNIPAFALVKGGKREHQIMMAGYKKHVGLYPHPTVMEYFTDELNKYKQGKGSVQFPINKPIPKELIVRMVKYRKELLKGKN